MEAPGAIKMHKKDTITTTSGFTLIELMLTMLISAILIAAIHSAYVAQNRVYTAQEAVTEMQQNIRAALEVLTRDIRMAGYDLSDTVATAFVDTVDFSNGAGLDEEVYTNAVQISFTADLNVDGAIDQAAQESTGDGNIDMSDMEQISYRLNGTDLQRYSTTSGAIVWWPVAEQIDNIEFRYLDSDGNVTTSLDRIRMVQVSILARANRPDPKFTNTMTYTTASGAPWTVNDNFRRRFLITSIKCRNMGL